MPPFRRPTTALGGGGFAAPHRHLEGEAPSPLSSSENGEGAASPPTTALSGGGGRLAAPTHDVTRLV
jgi:hypothetical protein